MPNTLIEENGKYGIDCKKALWASDDIHAVYHDCGLPEILCDTDFAVETDDKLLLIEYKNASIPEALAHAGETVEYDPMQQDKIRKIRLSHKFYGITDSQRTQSGCNREA